MQKQDCIIFHMSRNDYCRTRGEKPSPVGEDLSISTEGAMKKYTPRENFRGIVFFL